MFTFLTYVFYILGLWYLAIEISFLGNTRHRLELAKRFAYLNKGNKKHLTEVKAEMENIIKEIGGSMLFQFTWLGIGLFTVNWPVFLGILLTSILLGLIGSDDKKVSTVYVVLCQLQTLGCIAATLFILINKFHLHLPLGEIVLQWLGF